MKILLGKTEITEFKKIQGQQKTSHEEDNHDVNLDYRCRLPNTQLHTVKQVMLLFWWHSGTEFKHITSDQKSFGPREVR